MTAAGIEDLGGLRAELGRLLGWSARPAVEPHEVHAGERRLDGYREQLISYKNVEGEAVGAFLLRPEGEAPFPAAVVYHQHNGERHLGKSEIAGRAGDPLQAIGPVLARAGFVVLAPDAICFEDRRRNANGTTPHAGDDAQHYNEMAYRLVGGDLLMRVVLADAAQAVSVLSGVEGVDQRTIGAVGHSMGGHTTLFSAALDQRVRFVCISGALGSYQSRVAAGTGIELGQVIPGIRKLTDFDGLLRLIAPRPALVVSASEDPYSQDATDLIARAQPTYRSHNSESSLCHQHWSGGHALTEERIEAMTDWLISAAGTIRRAE